MFDSDQGLTALERGLEQALERFDPEVLDPSAAIELTEQFCRMERMCAAGKALAAGRVADTGAWMETAERSPAHLLAQQARCTVGHAVNVLDTAERMKQLDAASLAHRRGELSEKQAFELSVAASADPVSQQELLEAAELHSFYRFQQRCRAVKAAATPALQRHRQIYAKRYLRHWSDVEGAFCLEGRLTPEAGAQVLAALEPFRLKISARARRERREELARRPPGPWGRCRPRKPKGVPEQAQLADALVEMARQVSSGSEDVFRPGPSALVHVRVDHSALLRGDTVPGEICEVPGVGPISVQAARAFASDAFLCAIVTDGTDVKAVSRMGRSLPTPVRTALVERDRHCVVPGCPDTGPLENDHVKPVAQGGATKLSNLARLCNYHHGLKTYHGYRLERGPGRWSWVPPGGPPPDEQDPQPELSAAR